jgi:hypothetical protein
MGAENQLFAGNFRFKTFFREKIPFGQVAPGKVATHATGLSKVEGTSTRGRPHPQMIVDCGFRVLDRPPHPWVALQFSIS